MAGNSDRNTLDVPIGSTDMVRGDGKAHVFAPPVLDFIFAPFGYLWTKRRMIFRLYAIDMKTNAAGTLLGNWWAFLYPLLYFISYVVLFVFVFQVRFSGLSTLDYVAMILIGLAPALSFAQAIAGGVGSIVANSALLKGTLVDLEAVPVRHVLVAQSTLITGVLLAMTFFVATGRLGLTMPFFLVIWALQILWSIGLLWILAPVNVFVRDVGQIVPALITPLMMISPVAYPVNDAPAAIKTFLWINPFFYFISCYQDVIVFQRLPEISIFLAYATLSLGFFILGFHVVGRAKAALMDSM